MVMIHVVCGGKETDFSAPLSNQTGSFLQKHVAPEMPGHHFKLGIAFLNQKMPDNLSEIGLSLLDGNVYETIEAISGKHPFHAIHTAYREVAIRRENNQLKSIHMRNSVVSMLLMKSCLDSLDFRYLTNRTSIIWLLNVLLHSKSRWKPMSRLMTKRWERTKSQTVLWKLIAFSVHKKMKNLHKVFLCK